MFASMSFCKWRKYFTANKVQNEIKPKALPLILPLLYFPPHRKPLFSKSICIICMHAVLLLHRITTAVSHSCPLFRSRVPIPQLLTSAVPQTGLCLQLWRTLNPWRGQRLGDAEIHSFNSPASEWNTSEGPPKHLRTPRGMGWDLVQPCNDLASGSAPFYRSRLHLPKAINPLNLPHINSPS